MYHSASLWFSVISPRNKITFWLLCLVLMRSLKSTRFWRSRGELYYLVDLEELWSEQRSWASKSIRGGVRRRVLLHSTSEPLWLASLSLLLHSALPFSCLQSSVLALYSPTPLSWSCYTHTYANSNFLKYWHVPIDLFLKVPTPTDFIRSLPPPSCAWAQRYFLVLFCAKVFLFLIH